MANLLKRFFFACSGATVSILERTECETEHSKYVGIGATVFFTAVLAAISGAYALHKVMDAQVLAICFGLLWGMVIFNLDRYIVASLKSRKKDTTIALKQRLSNRFENLIVALPRVLLAVVFSIVIAKPLEIRLFEKEIDRQLIKERIEQEKGRIASDIQRLEGESEKLKTAFEAKAKERKETEDKMTDERAGRGYTHRAGEGQEFDYFQNLYNQANKEYAEAETNLKAKQKQLEEFRAKGEIPPEKAAESLQDNNGLAARLSALSSLTKDSMSKGDYTYYYMDWFIILFFILIELSPILVKLFTRYGPYDQIFDETEAGAMATAKGDSAVLSKMYEQMEQDLLKNPSQTVQAEFRNLKDDMARRIMTSWREKELSRLRRPVPAKKRK